jgi:hypothetical protein
MYLRDSDRRIASGTNHEAFILPTDQGRAYLENLPWAALRPTLQLAPHDWHSPGGSYLQ